MPWLQLGVFVITEWCTTAVPALTDGHLGICAMHMWFRFLLVIVQCFHRVTATLITDFTGDVIATITSMIALSNPLDRMIFRSC